MVVTADGNSSETGGDARGPERRRVCGQHRQQFPDKGVDGQT